MSSVVLRRVRALCGDDAVSELLRRADSPHDAAYLSDVANWMDYDLACRLLEVAAELTGEPAFARRAGEEVVRQHAGTAVATLLRNLGSPQAILEQISVTVTKFSTVTAMEPVDVAPGRAVVRAYSRPGYARPRHMCNWTAGMLSQNTVLFGLPPGAVTESECQVDGAPHCTYTVTWDAALAEGAADPQQLITALEARLVAMGERLDSAYATARDLIAHDGIDGALGRITDRAATAVRAPRYLLAVRLGAGEELQVHHRGFADAEARRAAHDLLATEPNKQDGSRLVVDVRSDRHHYGRIMALYPTDRSFFAQERDQLEVYARFAAAVLDTTAALTDAQRQHDQARALLELARAVAAAGTSEEVARNLAEAVPSVVDCDRTGVFVWDEDAHALRYLASVGYTEDQEARLAGLELTPETVPHIFETLAGSDPEPMFIGGDDPVGQALLREMGTEVTVLVPITARGSFFGLLNVDVTSRPERLRPTAELRDRLAGVVAHAATALANGRLVDRITREARHDSLTGLLGHGAFQEALALSVEAPAGERFSVALADIDDFKAVNDTHGHLTGDEALRHVAETLLRNVRDQDRVFRVGGEEFCVLMPGLDQADAAAVAERLRLAVARGGFTLPVRISIGVATYPADGTSRDDLLGRADAALYAAKRAGKNRTTLAADVAG